MRRTVFQAGVWLLALALGGCGSDSSAETLPGSGGAAGSGASGGSSGAGGGGAGGMGGTAGQGGGDCSAPSCDCNNCYQQKLCQGVDHDSAVQACIDTQSGLTTVIVESDSFEVLPGQEVYKCQDFKNPFGGQDVEIQRTESFMPPGSHHMFAFYSAANADAPIADCSGFEFNRSVHTSQSPYNVFNYPAGVAALVKGDEGVRLNAHYINFGKNALSGKVTTVFYLAKPGSVQQHAAHVFFNNLQILVQPRSIGNATKTCTIPKDLSLFAVTSHMHQFGVHFEASTSDGREVYTTDSWDNAPFKVFEPPMELKAGDKITFRCDYENPSNSILTFGDSAKTNEMCILSGRYFPAQDGETLDCQ